MSNPLSLRLAGGLALIDSAMLDADICIDEGRIAQNAARTVDVTGYLVLPGLIDLHGDGHERHFAPRRGAQDDPCAALRATEAELAANGITTAMIAQFYSWEGGMRGPDFAWRVARAIAGTPCLTDLHLQVRLELSLHEAFADVEALVEEAGARYVVLNDHIAHDALAQGKRPKRLTGQALKSGRSPDDHLALLQRLHSEMPKARAALPGLVARLKARGVRVGSHDDRTAEDRAAFRSIGADIAEFPETRAAAQAAVAAGDPVIMGAPNVVRGGSHDGKIAAADLVADGLVDALVSDYHYLSLHRAAFRLHGEGLALGDAWALVSSGPARVMGWTDRGVIAPGHRADLVLIHAETHRIEGTICAGRITHLTGELAARMVAG
ncbi:alpha-D-ribose 1-methylphosphonate 5-triphosphate diphosphatase [Hasllibacter sp. MH4015]|uniref:alpha-D-ribose 1-methylphosphonate 5-triphosphate diphosphatase n=1 Tax=Hasllibacter sp. MH4015 TaxID=2854029 RepID=UPI001CD7A318|nr:alpha-D-ribose 1-methylphosphonate 5-triphosphate diphosphatase [Hasllibacter sp. MH4015]